MKTQDFGGDSEFSWRFRILVKIRDLVEIQDFGEDSGFW